MKKLFLLLGILGANSSQAALSAYYDSAEKIKIAIAEIGKKKTYAIKNIGIDKNTISILTTDHCSFSVELNIKQPPKDSSGTHKPGPTQYEVKSVSEVCGGGK